MRSINSVTCHVRDMKEVVAFYRQTSGIEHRLLIDAETWMEFNTRPVALALVQ